MTRSERNEKLHQEAIARQLGRRYGKLTVIAYDKIVKENLYFICKCDCGNIKSIQKSGLVTGAVISCGCNLSESTTDECAKLIEATHVLAADLGIILQE